MTVFLMNISWETIEALRSYVYRTAHLEVLRQRDNWFEKFAGTYMALGTGGTHPGIDEARKRVAHLEAHGPTQFVFNFRTVFQPDEEFQSGIDWSSFEPCPAT